MARALLIGCGCRGRELGRRLIEDRWQVRGTSRDPSRLRPIADAGIEPALADPNLAGTVLEYVGDVTVVAWLMGSARGQPEAVAATHGPRLERVLEKLVDSPVRGFLYEGTGHVQPHHLRRGREVVEEAGERWRMPTAVLDADPEDPERWVMAAAQAVAGLVAAPS